MIRETVEQWKARTGKEPERLGPTHTFERLTAEEIKAAPRGAVTEFKKKGWAG